MQEFRLEKNKSSTYLLPIFAQYVPVSYFRLLINTYLWYDDYKEETFCILYKFNGRVSGTMNDRTGFVVYEEKTLVKSSYYLGSIDYGEYVMFKFELPQEMFDVRNLFLEGKYSKFKEGDKTAVLQFILRFFGPNEMNHIKKIFERDDELRLEVETKIGESLPKTYELSSSPYIEKECFSNAFAVEEELKLGENE